MCNIYSVVVFNSQVFHNPTGHSHSKICHDNKLPENLTYKFEFDKRGCFFVDSLPYNSSLADNQEIVTACEIAARWYRDNIELVARTHIIESSDKVYDLRHMHIASLISFKQKALDVKSMKKFIKTGIAPIAKNVDKYQKQLTKIETTYKPLSMITKQTGGFYFTEIKHIKYHDDKLKDCIDSAVMGILSGARYTFDQVDFTASDIAYQEYITACDDLIKKLGGN